MRGDCEQHGREHHQHRADDQHAPPAAAVGVGGEPQRDGGIPEQGQGEQQADLRLRQPGLHQVENQHHRQEAIRKQPQRSSGEEDTPVGGQGENKIHANILLYFSKTSKKAYMIKYINYVGKTRLAARILNPATRGIHGSGAAGLARAGWKHSPARFTLTSARNKRSHPHTHEYLFDLVRATSAQALTVTLLPVSLLIAQSNGVLPLPRSNPSVAGGTFLDYPARTSPTALIPLLLIRHSIHRAAQRLIPINRCAEFTIFTLSNPRRKHMKGKAILALLLIATLLLSVHTGATAHGQTEVGDYELEIGFKNEPSLQGEPNGLELFVTNKTTERESTGWKRRSKQSSSSAARRRS